MIKFLRFLESLLPVVFWVLLIFGFDSVYIGVLTLLAAIIHELGHIVVINALSSHGCHLPIGKTNGFRLECKGFSYTTEAAAAAAGPIANLLVGLFTIPFFSVYGIGYYLGCFSIINLMTAISNSLPIEGYDGYRVIHALVMHFTRYPRESQRALELTSLAFSFLLTLFSLFLMLKANAGYWIFAVFFSSTVAIICKRQKRAICEDTRENERF